MHHGYGGNGGGTCIEFSEKLFSISSFGCCVRPRTNQQAGDCLREI